MAEVVIEIEGLTKTYGSWRRRVAAVNNLNLSVQKGSVVAFVGPNGAGKTTTIHTLLGFLKPDTGRIRVFGHPAGREARRRIGYQSEIFHTHSYYKPAEVLRFYGGLSGMSRADLDRTIPAVLERLGLADALNRGAGAFSKGMTQRLGLAQALIHNPELLILDEPTSGLDPEGRRLVLDIIKEERQKGRTVFLSSHILADVERTCDEVVMIRKGDIVLNERIANFGSDGQQWQIEVSGWNPAAHAQVADLAFTILRETEESTVLVCASDIKGGLLHRLTGIPLEIGSVQRHRENSLEETYMKVVGRA